VDLFRIEVRVDGEVSRINQTAYLLIDGSVCAIDNGLIPPNGSKLATDADISGASTAKTQDQINSEARNYLSMTDWYITRFIETGTAIPGEVSAFRDAARASVKP